MDNRETPRSSRTGERIAVCAIVAAIVFLFFIFFSNVMLPLIRLQLRHDLTGAQRLLQEEGPLGAVSVVLIEALQMLVVFIPAEFIQISSALSYPIWAGAGRSSACRPSCTSATPCCCSICCFSCR